MHYYYAEGDEQRGPFEKSDLAACGLRPDSLVWHEGLPGWQPAGTLAELSDVLGVPAAYAMPAAGSVTPLLPYGGYAPAVGPPPAGMAITSLVLGIASIPLLSAYCLGLPVAVTAIVFGHIARWQVRRNQAGGAGMALAGLICGYVVIALAAAGMALFLLALGAFKMD